MLAWTLPVHGSGAPCPLVIQLSRFEADVFRPDGFGTTSYAMQRLAAHGFAVLTTHQYPTVVAGQSEVANTPEEALAVRDGVDAVVDLLVDRG